MQTYDQFSQFVARWVQRRACITTCPDYCTPETHQNQCKQQPSKTLLAQRGGAVWRLPYFGFTRKILLIRVPKQFDLLDRAWNQDSIRLRETRPDRGSMLQTCAKDGLEEVPLDSWFTHSFDQRACNSHRKKHLAKARQNMVKKDEKLKGNAYGKSISRLGLCMSWRLPVLRARDAFFCVRASFLCSLRPNGCGQHGCVPRVPLWAQELWLFLSQKSTSHKHCVSSSFFFSWAAATANWLRARLVPVSATLQGELQHSSWTSNHCDAPTFLQIMSEREWNYANRNEDSLKSKQSKNIKLSGPAMTVLLMATFEASN